MLFIEQYRSKLLNRFFIILTHSGEGRTWWIVAALSNILDLLGVQFVPRQQEFVRSFFAPLLTWLLCSLIKKLVSRKRPFIGMPGLSPLIQSPTCGSFPSAHAASTFGLFFALNFIEHPLAPWIGGWAALVSFSRVYLGVHYVSDVLGGVVVGFISAKIVILTAF